jgi:hypothetical protein
MSDHIPTCPRCHSQVDIVQHAIRHSLLRRLVRLSDDGSSVDTYDEEELNGEDTEVYFWCDKCSKEVDEEPEEEAEEEEDAS